MPKTCTRRATERAQAIVRGLGFRSLSQAARKVDLDYSTLHRVLRDGLSEDAKQKTVDALRSLGLLDLATRARPQPVS